MQTKYLIIPGYGNSGKDHWQTYFEKQLPESIRVMQKSWDKPFCEDWINAINDTVIQHDTANIVLVSHSMGGIAIAHWSSRFKTKIKGAFIVAPPDLDQPYLDLSLESFAHISTKKLHFPSIIIASKNDNWATIEKTQEMAHNWGSELVFIGEAGHINTQSGHGKWDEGLEMLKNFALDK